MTKIHCPKCLSADVCADAAARWDAAAGAWKLASVHDSMTCGACGYESDSGFLSETQDHYRVTWVIDVFAATPREAAQEARAIQLDSGSIATVFRVTKYTPAEQLFMDGVDIDLQESDDPEDSHES